MAEPLASSARLRRRRIVAWLLTLAVVLLYATLPDSEEAPERALEEEAGEESERLEIVDVAPSDPYPGSSVIVTHNGRAPDEDIHAYAGKAELTVLARHPRELVVRLPNDVAAGDLKVRLASGELTKAYHPRTLRSKPVHVRVKTPNWRKVFRSLVGGVALLAFGMALMARGVRAATGLSAARAVTRMAEHRSVAYGLGALTGAFAQSTTGAAGILAALTSSSLLPVLSGAVAFLGAQLGATLAPLLVTGLVEPREGLVAVTVGVLWLGLAADRRSAALGRLVLGAGFVAFGLQLFRPGLEPFLSDPVLLGWADSLRAESALDIAACALVGTLLVAALQGPAPLIVLILGVARTTGRWHLLTALALLSGTGLGAALAGLLTTAGGPAARKLARLNLCVGTASTLLSASSAVLFAHGASALLGAHTPPEHWTRRLALGELGSELALAFLPAQLGIALVLGLSMPRVARWLERRVRTPRRAPALGLPAELARVLELQQAALAHIAVLAQSGARGFGQRAEHTLAQARRHLDALLGIDEPQPQALHGDASLGAVSYSCFQLQQSLEALLTEAEHVTDAQLLESARLPWDDDLVLRELHELVTEGLLTTRACLLAGEPLNLDLARAREIKINRLEADARGVLLEGDPTPQLVQHQLHVLQVIDAYEVVGNQLYRLAESLGYGRNLPSLA